MHILKLPKIVLAVFECRSQKLQYPFWNFCKGLKHLHFFLYKWSHDIFYCVSHTNLHRKMHVTLTKIFKLIIVRNKFNNFNNLTLNTYD